MFKNRRHICPEPPYQFFFRLFLVFVEEQCKEEMAFPHKSRKNKGAVNAVAQNKGRGNF